MSRTANILSFDNQKALAISGLTDATKNLNTQTKRLKHLNDSTQPDLFTIWNNFSNYFEQISQIKQVTTSPSDSIILEDIMKNARTAAETFFVRLAAVLKKEWPQRTADTSKAIQKAKKTHQMKTGGAVHSLCAAFKADLEQYKTIEVTYRKIMGSLAYKRASLEITPDTLQADFLNKVSALQAKERADAEKGLGCCGLFSHRKKTNDDDDDEALLLLNSTKK